MDRIIHIASILALFLVLSIPGTVRPIYGEPLKVEKGTPDVQENKVETEIEEGIDFNEDIEDKEGKEITVKDPFEGLNRAVFWFNDKFYFLLLKPVARVYRIFPTPIRTSVSNFFSNVGTPIRVLNTLLQGKGKDMGNEILRLIINSTIGMGGLFDAAKTGFGISKKEEDFGQTLGVWGMGPGYYSVFPLIGPSDTRDTLGLIVDIFSDPFTYLLETEEYLIVKSGKTVNETSLDKDTYEAIKKQALDPYLFIRNAYEQRRLGLIRK